MFHSLVECETLEASSDMKLATFTYLTREFHFNFQSPTRYFVVHSEEEKSGESKNENDLNTFNKPKEGEEGGAKPKAKKSSEGNQGDTKTQDNQTPKEQVWEIIGKLLKSFIRAFKF